MPIYKYQCEACKETEEKVVPMSHMNEERRCVCGARMKRLMTLPQPARFQPTGRGMALDSLNSKDTAHMKPEYIKSAVAGLERPPKTIW